MPVRTEAADVSPAPVPPPATPSRFPFRTTLFCLLLLAIVLLQFSLLRAGLVLANRGSAAGTTPAELAGAFLRGLRFDVSTACYLLIPFIVVAHLPRVGLEASPRRRRWFFVALCFVIPVTTFILLAEFEFFREFQTRYNQLAFQYLDQPASGRLLDGENGHIGLVGITDLPFAGFIDAVRKGNQQVMKTMLEEARAAAKAAPEAPTPRVDPDATASAAPEAPAVQ